MYMPVITHYTCVFVPLVHNGRSISWSHIVKLYLKSSGTGLSIVPKVKYEHVYLTSFSKMRVDLAAQVYTCTYYVCDVFTLSRVFV